MANGSILAGIANPPGTNIPERLSNLQTARTQRTAQNLQNAQAQIDMIGRSSQSLLDSYYPEGSEQPTNPTQAAREYFRTRKQLVGMGVPENAIPEKVPTRSQLEQARDQALTVQQQLAMQAGPERQFETLSRGERLVETTPGAEGRVIAEGGREAQETAVTIRGGTPEAQQAQQQLGVQIPEGETFEIKLGQDNQGNVIATDVNRLGTSQQINVGSEQPTRFETDIQKGRAERIGTAQQEAQTSQQNLALFDTIKTSIEEGQAQTGFMGEGRRLTSQAMELVGLDPESVAPGFLSASPKVEAIEAAHSQLVNQLAAERGARITNFQARQLKRALPELEKSREGNLILADLFSNMARNKVEVGKIANIFSRTPQGELTQPTTVPGIGEMPEGTTFNEAVAEYESRNPVLTPELEDSISNAGQAAPVEAPTDAEGRLRINRLEVGEKYKHKGKIFRYWGDGNFQKLDE